MAVEPLDYESRPASRKPLRTANVAAAVVLIMVFIVNLFLLAVAWSDRSWSALGIAVCFGPITNAVLIVLILVCIPLVKSISDGESISLYIATVLVPLLAIPVDIMLIGMLARGGC